MTDWKLRNMLEVSNYDDTQIRELATNLVADDPEYFWGELVTKNPDDPYDRSPNSYFRLVKAVSTTAVRLKDIILRYLSEADVKIDSQIIEAYQKDFVGAVRTARQLYGMSIKEAKEFIEQHIADGNLKRR